MLKIKKISILLLATYGFWGGSNVYAQKTNDIIVNTPSIKYKEEKNGIIIKENNILPINKNTRKTLIEENRISKENPLEVSLVHMNNAKTISGKTAIRFKVMLEGRTGNEFDVRIEDRFENNSESMLSSIINNDEDIAIIPLNIIKENTGLSDLDLYLIPELILNTNDFYKITTSQVGKDLLKKINDNNNDFIALTFISGGKKIIVGKDKIFDLDKIKNKKIMINEKGLTVDYYNLLEAKEIIYKDINTEPNIDFKDIDYIETTIEKYKEYNLSKVYKNINDFYNTYDTQVLIINKKFYNSLPVKYKNDIGFILKNVLEYNLDELERVEKLNKIYFTNQNIGLLEDAYQKSKSFENNAKIIHNKYLKNINSELLLESYEILNN